jgi:hypothetical protein
LLKSRLSVARSHSLREPSVVRLCLIATLALGAGSLGFNAKKVAPQTVAAVTVPVKVAAFKAELAIAQSVPAQVLAEAGADVAAAIAEKPVSTTREAELDDDETFAEFLANQGIADSEAAVVMNALAKVYNLRQLKAGQDVTLSFLRTGQKETFTGATFQPEDTREIVITRTPTDTFKAEVVSIPVVRHRFAARGQIRSSLYEAGDNAGVPHAIMATLLRTYAHDIDFQRDIHPGDSFEVLYDQSVTAKGKSVGEGTIIYAAMHVGGKTKPIYRVTFSDNTVDYFDEAGRSIRRALLRTPVAAAKVTSGFGMRMHPLLGYTKMHKGVDFGAPIGTPIFAAGSGTIDEIGLKNGYGRYIRIRHNNIIETAYAHMSRFNANLYRGARVNQGQVIGYVGMSGRATGPHLHFEVQLRGQQVNPMSVNMPTGRVLEGKLLATFKQGQSHIRNEFSSLVDRKVSPTSQSSTSGSIIPASAKSISPTTASRIGKI